MKYIIVNEWGRVARVRDTSREVEAPRQIFEVTDAIAAAKTEEQTHWLNGAFATREEYMADVRANDENYVPWVPARVTARQFKLQLFAQGDWPTITALVAAQDEAIQIEWDATQEFARAWPTLAGMIQYLQTQDAKWTDAYVDATFINANKL